MNMYWMRYVKQDQNGDGSGGGAGTSQNAQQNTQGGNQQQNNAGQQQQQQQQSVQPKWPDNWRQEMTGGDEKELKQAERYLTPSDVWKKARALEQKLSSGEYKAVVPFPEKGSPEEQTAWRKENGIPDAADKYQLKLKEGLVIGEVDKPVIDDFLKYAHSKNLSNDVASAAVQWYFDFQQKEQEQYAVDQKQAKQEVEDTLRKEWGNEYRANRNSIENFLDAKVGAGSDLRKLIMGGIETNADFAKFMAGVVREINPVTTLIPGAGNNPNLLADEIAEIEKQMGNRASDYWKGQRVTKNGIEDTAMAHRYRELLAARDRVK